MTRIPGSNLPPSSIARRPAFTATLHGPLRDHLGDDAFFRLLDDYDIGLL